MCVFHSCTDHVTTDEAAAEHSHLFAMGLLSPASNGDRTTPCYSAKSSSKGLAVLRLCVII